MHPAPSIILFTVLSGMGFGLLIWLGLGVTEVSGWMAFGAFGLGYGLALVGLMASTLHLGHPERALKACGSGGYGTICILACVSGSQRCGRAGVAALGRRAGWCVVAPYCSLHVNDLRAAKDGTALEHGSGACLVLSVFDCWWGGGFCSTSRHALEHSGHAFGAHGTAVGVLAPRGSPFCRSWTQHGNGNGVGWDRIRAAARKSTFWNQLSAS